MNVAVVILNWNGEKHLREFLPSVINHTPQCVDIVVIDNGSTDTSISLLRSDFPRVKIVELDANYGFAGGYNRGLQHLEYTYVVLLNSDVQVSEGWCDVLIERLENNPTLGAVAPKLLSYCEPTKFEYAGAAGGYIDFLGYPFCRGRILNHTEVDSGQYDDTQELFWVSGAAFACRLDLFRELGGFDDDFFAHMEEIDLCWRMQLAGYKIELAPKSVVYHLGGGTLTTNSPTKVFLNHRNNLAMLYKCAPTQQRIVVAVVRPILDLLAAFSYLAQGEWRNFIAVMKAYRDFICSHRSLAGKRKTIRSTRKKESTTIYRGSILLRFLIGKRTYKEL